MQHNCFINFFDFYGKEFKINVSGNERVKTLGGSLIGFLSLCTIIAYLVYQLIHVLNKDLTSVLYNETTTNIPVNNFTNVPLMFKVIDASGRKVPTEGLYSIEPIYINYSIEKDSQNISRGYIQKESIKLEPCEREKHLGAYLDLFEKMDVEDYHCIPSGKHNMTLFGSFGDLVNGFSELIVYVTKCSNTSQKCFDEEKISKKLSGVYMVFAHVGYQIDNFNYTKPNQIKVITSTLSFTYHLLKRWNLSFMPMTYETDYGFIFEHRIQENYFTLNSIYPDVDPVPAGIINPNPQIASFHISNTESTGHYFRSYIKFSNIIASAGGVIKIIMTICQLLNYMCSDNIAYKKVSNLIFSFDEDTQTKYLSNKNFTSNFIIPQEVSKISRRLKQR
jgi:hypothetical protein